MLQTLILLVLSGGMSVQEYTRMVEELRVRKVTKGNEKVVRSMSPRGVFRVEQGCILVEGSTCSLSSRGRELLAANKTVALIRGRVVEEETV